MNNCTKTGDQSAPRAIKDVKVGDIIVGVHGGEAKVLEVFTNTFLRSWWDNFEEVGEWLTFEQAEANGWKIKGSEEGPFIFVDGERYRLVKE